MKATDIPEAARQAVYRRDNGCCRWCGRMGMWNHVHHINYRSAGGSHEVSNLILLCHIDHAMVHSNKNFYPPLLHELVESPGVTGFSLLRRHARAEKNGCASSPSSVDQPSSDGSTGY